MAMSKPGARATVRYLHTSAYKVRQVLELVRGLPVGDGQKRTRTASGATEASVT